MGGAYLVGNRPATHSYHAERVSPENATIADATLAATTDRNESVARLTTLSKRERNAIRRAISSPDSESEVPKRRQLSVPEYVVNESRLYAVSTRTVANGTTLSVTPVTGERRLAVVAVPVSRFENDRNGVVPKATHRHIVRTAIRSGSYRNPLYVDIDDLIVHYEGRYYRLSATPIGFVANLKLLGTLLGIALSLIAVLAGIYRSYSIVSQRQS